MIAIFLATALASQTHAMGPLAPLSCEEERAADMSGGSTMQAFGAPLVLGGVASVVAAFLVYMSGADGGAISSKAVGIYAGAGAAQLLIGGILVGSGRAAMTRSVLKSCPPKPQPTAPRTPPPADPPAAEPPPDAPAGSPISPQ